MSQFNDEMNKKAVALSYDEESNAAPVIVASGSGYLAQKIVETARSNGIPVYEDNSLATVLSQMELGSEIPEQLYQAIVDIYVYFLNFGAKNKGGANQQKQQAQPDQAARQDQQAQQAQTNQQAPAQTAHPTETQGADAIGDAAETAAMNRSSETDR